MHPTVRKTKGVRFCKRRELFYLQVTVRTFSQLIVGHFSGDYSPNFSLGRAKLCLRWYSEKQKGEKST